MPLNFQTKKETNDLKNELSEKILNRAARVGVVGLGYVGVPFAIEQCRAGYSVIGIDENKERIYKVNHGKNYIPDVNNDEFSEFVRNGTLRAENDYSVIPQLDIIIIAVPTPLTKNLVPDLSFIERATKQIAKYIHSGQLVSLESTTYPGTTRHIMAPILATSGLLIDKDYFLVHSPERVDPGNQLYSTKNTAKIVGGVGPISTEIGTLFYSQSIEKVIPVSSCEVAELVKLFENSFRAVNIAFVNELAMLCDKFDINVWEVLDAAFTKPFGIIPFYPGPGVGGHCIPLDPHYLEWKAREVGFETRFISLAGETNRRMPHFVKYKAMRVLNKVGLALSKAKILVLGVAYKKDSSDCRESPAVDLIKLLLKEGASVTFSDSYVQKISEHNFELNGEILSEKLLEEHDLVIITTDHSNVDYKWVAKHSKLILDTRNATKNVFPHREKIVLL